MAHGCGSLHVDTQDERPVPRSIAARDFLKRRAVAKSIDGRGLEKSCLQLPTASNSTAVRK